MSAKADNAKEGEQQGYRWSGRTQINLICNQILKNPKLNQKSEGPNIFCFL